MQGVIVFLAEEKMIRHLSLPRSTYPNTCRIGNVVVGVHVRRRHTRRCLEIERQSRHCSTSPSAYRIEFVRFATGRHGRCVRWQSTGEVRRGVQCRWRRGISQVALREMRLVVCRVSVSDRCWMLTMVLIEFVVVVVVIFVLVGEMIVRIADYARFEFFGA